jgi:hypothetical protein
MNLRCFDLYLISRTDPKTTRIAATWPSERRGVSSGASDEPQMF